MIRALPIIVLTLLLLAGCGGVEWFPETSGSGTTDSPSTPTDPDPGTTTVTVTAFSFAAKTNVNAGQLQTSETVTVQISGATSVPISVTGGEYSIDDGAFTADAGTVTTGSVVRVRHLASSTIGESVVTTLTMGDKSAEFTSTTGVPVVTAFSFPARTNVTAGETQTSDPVTITVSGGPVPILVSAGLYQKNTGGFISSAGIVASGDVITVRHIHPPGVLQAVTTLTIGGQSATFTSSTIDSTSNVPPFSFPARENVAGGSTQSSDPITVTLTQSEPISVSGGEYRINTGAFTSESGFVSSGDSIIVRHTAASSGQTVTTLTIGDRSATFTSTTAVAAAP